MNAVERVMSDTNETISSSTHLQRRSAGETIS